MSLKRNGTPRVCGVYLFTCNLFALTAAVTLSVNQDSVNGTVGQSVLLSASYTVSNSSDYLRITWIKDGTRIVEYKCGTTAENITGCSHYLDVPDHSKHRVDFFPVNASLLLKDLQFNDSGTYEFTIADSTGTEKGSIMLTVQLNTAIGKDRTWVLRVIIPLIGLAVIFTVVWLILKIQRGWKRTQEQTGKRNGPEGSRKSKDGAELLYAEINCPRPTEPKRQIHVPEDKTEYASVQKKSKDSTNVLYTDINWPPLTRTKKKIHFTKETVVCATVQNSSSNPAALYSEIKSSESTGTNGSELYVADEKVEYAHIQMLRN